VYNKAFGSDGLTIQSLRDDGYQAIFLGLGLPNPNIIPIFNGITQSNGLWTSKDFLPIVAAASKAGNPFSSFQSSSLCSALTVLSALFLRKYDL